MNNSPRKLSGINAATFLFLHSLPPSDFQVIDPHNAPASKALRAIKAGRCHLAVQSHLHVVCVESGCFVYEFLAFLKGFVCGICHVNQITRASIHFGVGVGWRSRARYNNKNIILCSHVWRDKAGCLAFWMWDTTKAIISLESTTQVAFAGFFSALSRAREFFYETFFFPLPRQEISFDFTVLKIYYGCRVIRIFTSSARVGLFGSRYTFTHPWAVGDGRAMFRLS